MAIRTPYLYEYGNGTFILTARLSLRDHVVYHPNSMLFLQSTCYAIADYCLLGRHQEALENQGSLWLDPNSPEHLEVCLRMKRCGAVRCSPKDVYWDEEARWDLMYQSRTLRFIFGWPTAECSNGRSIQPVWVYYITHTSHPLRQIEVLQKRGMEGLLGFEWLANCSTMSEYCERLRIRGAIFYKDVRDSPEAMAMGLVERPASIDSV